MEPVAYYVTTGVSILTLVGIMVLAVGLFAMWRVLSRLTATGQPTHAVHIPYTVEQDEDGVWCADAQLRPGVGAHGYGDTRDEAIADLREALIALIETVRVPDEIDIPIPAAA